MTKKSRSKLPITITVILGFLIIVVAAVLIIRTNSVMGAPETKAEATDGLIYIQQAEAMDTTAVEDTILQRDQARDAEYMLAQIEADPDLIWKTLKDLGVLIIGDSRAQCFLAYEYMDDAHCIVEQSTTIYKINEILDEIKARAPRAILISYGINDVGLYHDVGVESYMNDFAALIDAIKQAVPGIKVYVNSIIPCLESEYDRAPNWMAIPAWNEYIKNYCETHDIGYIDITDLANEHRDSYYDDGVHLAPDFYPYWGARIAAQITADMSSGK